MFDPTPDLLNTTDRRILFLNKTETIRITDIQGSGTYLTLSVSTHPSQSSGVNNLYPASSTLELVKMIEYEWTPANGSSGATYPYLTRRDNATPFIGGGVWEVSAAHIEDFQVTESDGEFTVEIIGIASEDDGKYIHPSHQDHRRRRTVWGIARPRNE
jgi:hypothetical protein